jgi:flagellar motility protein MotE (MotC chaperone)
LAARKKELDQREEELVRREEQVAKLKEEVEGKLKEIQGYRNSIAVLLQDRVATDSAKVDTLVQVYSNMKPSQAAKVFETMDEDLVIERKMQLTF